MGMMIWNRLQADYLTRLFSTRSQQFCDFLAEWNSFQFQLWNNLKIFKNMPNTAEKALSKNKFWQIPTSPLSKKSLSHSLYSIGYPKRVLFCSPKPKTPFFYRALYEWIDAINESFLQTMCKVLIYGLISAGYLDMSRITCNLRCSMALSRKMFK